MNEEIEIVETPHTEEKKASNPKYKQKKFIIPVVIGIIGIIAALNYFNYATTYESTDDAYIEGHNIQISPKISGNIIKVLVNDNQKVKKGQILAEIDPADYKVKCDQAEARLQEAIEKFKNATVNVGFTAITSSATADQANSGVGMARAAIKIAEKQISQAKAGLAQISDEIISDKADYDFAKTDYDRYQKLYAKGAVSKQDYERISTAYKTSISKLDAALQKKYSAQSSLDSAYANKESSIKAFDQALGKYKGASTVNQQIAMSNFQKRAAIAQINQLKTSLNQAKLDLSYTKICAPSDGYVTAKSVEEGAYVQIGQPLLSIIPQERWVIANFKEIQLTNMKIGQLVKIKVDAYPFRKFIGRVDSIQASTGSKTSLFPPENAVGSFVKVVQRVPVKIVFNDKYMLRVMEIAGAEADLAGELAAAWLAVTDGVRVHDPQHAGLPKAVGITQQSHPAGEVLRLMEPRAGGVGPTFAGLPVAVQRRVVQAQLLALGLPVDFSWSNSYG